MKFENSTESFGFCLFSCVNIFSVGAMICCKGERNMEINYSLCDGSICANLSGELDECSAEFVRLSLDMLLKDPSIEGERKLILDFSSVSFMDSTGIGVLLGRYNKFTKKDISLFIKNPQRHVDRILKMTGIYELMPKVS